jgi:hypothetical protein
MKNFIFLLTCSLFCVALQGDDKSTSLPAKAPSSMTVDELDHRIQELKDQALVFHKNARAADRRASYALNRDWQAFRTATSVRDRFLIKAAQLEQDILMLEEEKTKRAGKEHE